MSKKSDRLAARAAAAAVPEVSPVEVAPVALVALPRMKRSRKPKSPKPCECGCGLLTRGGRFVPGHDGRLHGWVLRVQRGVVKLADIPAGERAAVERVLGAGDVSKSA